MLARCVATLKPPPELTLSQWADRYRMLSAESSAEPGRWHTDKAPYQREIIYDEAENTTADLLDGKITFHQYITPYTPAEDIEDVIEFDPDALTTALS